jgi:hypothetical protein
MTSALWAHDGPPRSSSQARAAVERLEKTHLDFPVTLADYLTTLAIALHATRGRLAACSGADADATSVDDELVARRGRLRRGRAVLYALLLAFDRA